jgi:hypothetical protein
MIPPEPDPAVLELQSLIQQLVQGIRQSVEAVPHADLRNDLRHIAGTLEEANANLLAEHAQAEAELAALRRQFDAQPIKPPPAAPEDVLALGLTIRGQLLDRYARKAPAAHLPTSGHGNVWSSLEGVTSAEPPPAAEPGKPDPEDAKPDQQAPPQDWQDTSQIEGV